MRKKDTESADKKPTGSRAKSPYAPRVKTPYEVKRRASMPTGEPAALKEDLEPPQVLSGSSGWVKRLLGGVGLAAAAAAGADAFPVPAPPAAHVTAPAAKPGASGPAAIADSTGAAAYVYVAPKDATAPGVCQVVVTFPSGKPLDNAQMSRLVSEVAGPKAESPEESFAQVR